MDPIIRLEEKLNIANNEIKDGYFESAVRKLEEILDESPNFGKAHNHLGFLYETKFYDYEKAEHHYKLAWEKSPNYPSIYYNYAILLSNLKKYDALNYLLEKALKVPGINQGTIFNEYAIMFEQLEEYDRAIKYYKDTIRNSFDANVIDKAKESIERCKMKIEVLGN